MLYSSLENSKIKELRKLKQKKYHDKSCLFLAEGEHLVLEAYKSGYLKEVLLLENESLNLDVPISYVTDNVMKSLSSLDTVTPMIGVCAKKENMVIGNRVLILDEVQDPGNMGTIIRSAVAFNIDTIILSENCADIYSFRSPLSPPYPRKNYLSGKAGYCHRALPAPRGAPHPLPK